MSNGSSDNSSIIATLTILRQAGFYQAWSDLTAAGILAQLHQQKKDFFADSLRWDYTPDRKLSDKDLVISDDSKVLYIDLEADVSSENKIYSALLREMEKISGKLALITEIQETWRNEKGPIHLTCKINGQIKHFQPVYNDDWVDQNFLDDAFFLVSNMTNQVYHLCLGPEAEWLAQDVCYIRLTPAERAILETGLHFVFFDTFIKEIQNKK